MILKKLIFALRIALALTVIIIFSFSLKNGEESTDQSNWVAQQMQAVTDFTAV